LDKIEWPGAGFGRYVLDPDVRVCPELIDELTFITELRISVGGKHSCESG
jgi:hypothetical protein